MAANEPKLIAGNANLPLAKAIARRMSLHRGLTIDRWTHVLNVSTTKKSL